MEMISKIDRDQMNLYDYVMTTFDSMCDLTEGRLISLRYYLDLYNARSINVAEFRAVFDVNDGFLGVMHLLTDFTQSDRLVEYGRMCKEAALNTVPEVVVTLDKKPQL